MKGQLARISSFATESEMGEVFISSISPRLQFNQVIAKREFKSPQGIPDFLLCRKCESSLVYVVALELKLKDWKKGLFQAFKYRSYCNSAYVIIDLFFKNEVTPNLNDFVRANIGLAFFSLDGDLEIAFDPKADIPFSIYYSSKLDFLIKKNESTINKKCRFHRSKLGAISLRKFSHIETNLII